jgi:hypothetical protein
MCAFRGAFGHGMMAWPDFMIPLFLLAFPPVSFFFSSLHIICGRAYIERLRPFLDVFVFRFFLPHSSLLVQQPLAVTFINIFNLFIL